MNRQLLVSAALVPAFCLAGCGTPSGLVVAGTVDDTVTSLAAPALGAPAVNLDAGFVDLTGPTSPVTGRTANATSTVASALGLGTSVRIVAVGAAVGDTVRAGQVLATADTRTQAAQLAAAKADAAVAKAQVGLLGDAIDTTYDKQADIEDAKDTVRTAIDKIHTGQKQLRAAERKARAARADLATKLHAMEALAANYPPVVPPGSDIPPEAALPGIIADLKAGIRKVDAGLKKIDALQAKLAKGLKKAKSGLRKLEDATAKVTDARSNLRDLKELAGLQAEAMTVPIDVVRAQVTLAEMTSPVDGIVVSIARPGDQLAPGATVATVREQQPSTVTAWLSPAQLAQVCDGDSALVTADWITGPGVPATLTRITTRADYPPTSVPTDEVHLTRAVEVAFTATEQLPAGAPVEITIQGCRPSAPATNPNR